MRTIALEEGSLWKSKLRQNTFPLSFQKEDMILPKICTLTGRVLGHPDYHQETLDNYAKYSQLYWEGVEKRKQIYRMQRYLETH
jgi:hypothetical protein